MRIIRNQHEIDETEENNRQDYSEDTLGGGSYRIEVSSNTIKRSCTSNWFQSRLYSDHEDCLGKPNNGEEGDADNACDYLGTENDNNKKNNNFSFAIGTHSPSPSCRFQV